MTCERPRGGGWAGPACREHRSRSGEAVSVGGFDDDAGGGHGGQALVERCCADAAGRTQFGEWLGLAAVRERLGDTLIHRSRFDATLGLEIGLDGLQGEDAVALGELERDAGHRSGGAMLGGQDDAVIAVAAEIEVGIAPGVELGRSAQGLAGADGSSAFSGVVDECHGCGVPTLQVAQKGKQGRHIAADILVDAVQAYERIEDQEPGLERGNGFIETRAVGLKIEAQAGCGDDLDVEFGEAGAGGGADALEAASDDMECILGRIEQDPASVCGSTRWTWVRSQMAKRTSSWERCR